MEVLMVTVANRARIPYFNYMGPIVEPQALERAKVENLLKMGYMVRVHGHKAKTADEFTPVDGVELDELEEVSAISAVTSVPVVDEVVAVHEEELVEEEITEVDAEGEAPTEEVAEEQEEEDEVLDTLAEFRALTVKQLIAYLKEDAQDVIPDDIQAEVGRSIKLKDDLLEVIATYVVN